MRRTFPVAIAMLSACASCTHREPPTPDGSPSAALPELPSTSAATSTPTATTTATPTATDPAFLPQTHDLPLASGPAFDARVAAFWDAVIRDDPQRGMPFFFPLGAYQQVKDIGDPGADWKHRLVAAYEHDIHALHSRLGDGADRAKLVSFDVPNDRARWVDPGEEWNKIGYYRVFGSKLHYEIDGTSRAFEIKSLISWRGQWFIVHLSAIK
jgi:hypothetical protein